MFGRDGSQSALVGVGMARQENIVEPKIHDTADVLSGFETVVKEILT